jgi:hypothetical protein
MTAAAVTCGQTLARTLRDAGVTHMFGLPGGEIRRAPVRRNPEVRSRASASRSNAVSFWTRRRSFRTSCRRLLLREVLHIQTNQRPSAPRPASHAPLSEGCRGPWRRSCLRCVGRGAEGGALLRACRARYGNDHRPLPHRAQLSEDDRERHRANVTTTRAAKCRMSVGTALLLQ